MKKAGENFIFLQSGFFDKLWRLMRSNSMDEERLSQAESAPQEDASDTQACTPTSPSPDEDERAGTIPPVFLDGEKQGGAEEEGAGREKADGSAVTIPVRYNHETRALSLDQARVLAQKGMKFDELSPTLEKMKFLAAAEGKSLPELADQLLQRRDQELYDGLLEECYGDEELAKRMFEAEKAKRQARWESAREQEAAAVAQDREELHRRLADQYLELKKLVPDIGEFSRLPRQVRIKRSPRPRRLRKRRPGRRRGPKPPEPGRTRIRPSTRCWRGYGGELNV